MYAVKLSDIHREDNSISRRLSYTPSMFIYVDGEVAAFLDPGSDDDLQYYQSLEGLSTWAARYLDVEIVSSDTENPAGDCDSSGCTIEP